MKVKIKPLHDDFVMPAKGHDDDYCFDVVAVTEEEIAPNVWKYGLGFALEIDRGYETLYRKGGTILKADLKCAPLQVDIEFRPRSSVYKTGMVLSNCVGTIDEGYRGEVSAVFYHVMPGMPRYKVGDRIGQILLGCALPMEFEPTAELSATVRGVGGFGSTGK